MNIERNPPTLKLRRGARGRLAAVPRMQIEPLDQLGASRPRLIFHLAVSPLNQLMDFIKSREICKCRQGTSRNYSNRPNLLNEFKQGQCNELWASRPKLTALS